MCESESRSIRILHYPTDVGGNPTGLAQAERRYGASSTVAVITQSSLGYDVDINLDLSRKSRLNRLAHRVFFAARSIRNYDVFHFNFAQTFLPRLGSHGIDLQLLRAMGKRIFMTFQGCDVRLAQNCRVNDRINSPDADHSNLHCCGGNDIDKARAVSYIRKHAHRTFCLNPDLMRYVPDAEFVPYAAVDPALVTPTTDQKSKGKLTILHAPTNRLIKGTQHVLDIAEKIGNDNIEWMFVENVPHEEAIRRYRQADLVIDQLRLGWYGAFAVEMMAMSKPVICYIAEEDLRFIPQRMAEELPIIDATPDTLQDVLQNLINAPARLTEIGVRSREFVENWHDPDRIARRFLEMYRDPTIPFWPESGRLPD